MVKGFRQTIVTTSGVILASLLAASCGGGGGSGGGGGGGTPPPPPGGGGSGGGGTSGPEYTPGVFEPSSEFVDRCEMPRAGTDDMAGSTELENFWLRSWSNETYLWYDEIQDRDPGLYDDTLEYFELLKTTALTSSGNPKDQFHYTYDTEEYQQLVNSGEDVQYGAEFVIIQGAPPRDVRIAFVQDDSPASDAGLGRGTQILEIDGVDVTNGSDTDTLNAGLFPSTAGESHTFLIQDLGSATTREVTLSAEVIAFDPVQDAKVIDDGGDQVGYLHLITFGTVSAEEQLIDAMTDFAAAGVTDLIVDLRYNGGGFLDISAELGYMIAGPDQIGNDFYEELVFNDKNPDTNPVTGNPLEPTPFHSTSQGFSVASGQQLPDLDLERVVILTTAATCSASESLINALNGIGVQVGLIGGTTCGKPYGFYPTDNCGTTYFTIQFRGENAEGFGDYADGFRPEENAPNFEDTLFGCGRTDDFGHALGDPEERLLETALTFRTDFECPGAGASSADMTTASTSMERAILSGDSTTIDPQSLYSSQILQERLLRKRIRDLTLNRPGARPEDAVQ